MDIRKLLVDMVTAVSILYGEPSKEQETLWCLTENVIYETASIKKQPLEGKLAVMETVSSRVKDSRYPDSYCEVIFQRKQYSWTLIAEEFRWKPSDRLIESSAQLTLSYLRNKLPKTSVYGATHFINPDAVSKLPEWYWKYEYMGKIGDHEFFKRPPRRHREVAAKHKRKQRSDNCTKLC